MHIIRFEAQNIQRLQAVTIEPSADSPAVVLAGGNEEGKSSCLDAIEMALAGERTIPPEPIRRGQEKASVIVDLGDMIVTRRFTKGGSSITVTNREGLKYPSPQALLDGLYNKLTFDPLAFAGAKPDEQAAILRRLAGLDVTDLDKERAMVYATRTEVNRDLAKAKAIAEKAPHYADAGEEPQEAAEIVALLAEADQLAEVNRNAERMVTLDEAAKSAATERVLRAEAAVHAARRALEQAERDLDSARVVYTQAEEALAISEKARQVAQAGMPDVSALREQLAGAQAHNAKVEANRRRAELLADVDALKQKADGHTARLESIDQEKATRLAEAKFPIEGLGLSDEGVTWNGLPFEQASTAIRTRVSVAIGIALNPKLRVLLVRNGNDLDGKNLQLLADTAREFGVQLWIERIAGGDGLQTVVIEDGAVKGAEPVQAAAPEPQPSAPAAAEKPARGRRRGAAGLPLDGDAR